MVKLFYYREITGESYRSLSPARTRRPVWTVVFSLPAFENASIQRYISTVSTLTWRSLFPRLCYTLFTGARQSDQSERVSDIRNELADVSIAPFDGDAAEEAAMIRATLADRGELINKLDILIAGPRDT